MIGLEYEGTFYDHLELKAMIKIYNRLKKRIEEIDKELKIANPETIGVTSLIIEELQKILGEDK